MKDDDAAARKRRTAQLKKKIAEVTAPLEPSLPNASAQRPGESDAEYVHRRMRELERPPKRP